MGSFSLHPAVPNCFLFFDKSLYLQENKPKIDASLVEHNSHMKAAIPVLPIWLAWFCCVMNCIGPGTGGLFGFTDFHLFLRLYRV